MKNKVFGYMLGKEFLILLESSLLIPIGMKKASPVHLRPTMFRLLIYLIEHASPNPIPDDDIMRDVWEKNGLSASKARLWQVMNAMSKKLCLKDTFCDFCYRVHNIGYYVNKDYIRVIYTNEKYPDQGGTCATKWPLHGHSHNR